MKLRTKMILTTAFCAVTALAMAQGPGRGPRGGGPGGPGGEPVSKQADTQDVVTRMLAFDKNGDGVLTKEEVTDARLSRLFTRADVDKDGKVTKAELTTLAEKEHSDDRGGPGGFGGPGGPDGPAGFGPPPGGGPGFGPPGGGPPGRPRIGEILPPFVQDQLDLSEEQIKLVAALQKDVDAKLAKILTSQQNTQLKQMRDRGPGRGPGGPGGRGGPGGGFGGPPDDGPPGGGPPGGGPGGRGGRGGPGGRGGAPRGGPGGAPPDDDR